MGYLPGDIESKLDPFMQPLYDNLAVIKNQFNKKNPGFKRINNMLENQKLHITLEKGERSMLAELASDLL